MDTIDITSPTDNGIDSELSIDPSSQIISLAEITGATTISGLTETVYTIPAVVTFKDYEDAVVDDITVSVDQTLTVKNPCIDSDFANIEGPVTLPTLEYDVDSGLTTFAPHDPITLVLTYPVGNTDICGALTLTAQLDGTDITGSGPLFYDSDTFTFSADSSDSNLLGTSTTYTVVS